MQTINILELAPQVREWISQIQIGQDVLITAGDHAVAKITRVNSQEITQPSKGTAQERRQSGLIKGPAWMSPEFDEPLEEFAEYM